MAKAVQKHITPHRKSQARPAQQPGPWELIADRVALDRIESAPLRLGFRLSRGDHWSGQNGRLELDQENAVELALKILGVLAGELGANFTREQRLRVASLATRNVHGKRQHAVLMRYNAREITLEEANRLREEVRAQNLAEIDALAAA